MVNKKRLAETFKTLVSIDSVSREEGRVSREIRKMLEPLNPEVFIDDAGRHTGSDTGNLILRIAGTRDVPPLMLNAHMDTVEPGRGVKPRFVDGVFYSDGTTVLGADDKSALAIIIETVLSLHENNTDHGPLELVFTICEEIGLQGAKSLDFSLISAKYGYALDTADTETIITRAPTANHFELVVHGKAAHAGAEPEKGINAIVLASRAIASLELGRIDEETTANIGVFQCEGATNIVPETARIKGEVRSHDPAKLDAVTRKILDAFDAQARTWPREQDGQNVPRVTVDLTNEFPRTHIPEEHAVVRMAKTAAARLGRELVCRRTGGGADANIFFGKGIVTGVIGTGMREIHTVRENIAVDDMARTVELLTEIIGLHAHGDYRP